MAAAYERDVPANELTLGSAIGEGGFGKVLRATWKPGGGDDGKGSTIAVKQFTEEKFFQQERAVMLQVMRALPRPGDVVVPLLGCCSARRWLLYELMPAGDAAALVATAKSLDFRLCLR